MRRVGRAGLTKEMLLPLSTDKVRALSLENHLAPVSKHSDHGSSDAPASGIDPAHASMLADMRLR